MRIRIDAYTLSAVASFTTIRIGERVRIRGQTWGTSYRVVGEYIEPVVGTDWIYGHLLKRNADLAKGRKFTSGSFVRVEDSYYYVQGYTGFLEDDGGLEAIFSHNYDSLGLPATPNTPPRPPTPQEKERMEQHAMKVKVKEREQVAEAEREVSEAERKVEREDAICFYCEQPNHVGTISTGARAWFLIQKADKYGVRRWTCPRGEHMRPLPYPSAKRRRYPPIAGARYVRLATTPKLLVVIGRRLPEVVSGGPGTSG